MLERVEIRTEVLMAVTKHVLTYQCMEVLRMRRTDGFLSVLHSLIHVSVIFFCICIVEFAKRKTLLIHLQNRMYVNFIYIYFFMRFDFIFMYQWPFCIIDVIHTHWSKANECFVEILQYGEGGEVDGSVDCSGNVDPISTAGDRRHSI